VTRESFEKATWSSAGKLTNPLSSTTANPIFPPSTFRSGAAAPWTRATGETPSPDTGPQAAHSGVHYVFTEASDSAPETEFVLSFPNALLGTNVLTFAYHMHGNDIGNLSLATRCHTAQGNATCHDAWQVVWSRAGEQQHTSSDPWLHASVRIDAPPGGLVARFVGTSGSDGSLGDIAIDTVEVHHSGGIGGATFCATCPAGKYNAYADTECETCEAGQETTIYARQCVE
jgi:hypothetical protein